ncbi:MAG: uroporphyrinogen-III synthase [Hyphomicrobiales bacterium]
MKVLVLRAQPAAARTARCLARLGHDAVVAPLFEVAPLNEGRLPADKFEMPYGAVIAASANAFAALHAESRGTLAGLPVLVVGERTARAAESMGLRPVRPAFQTARELASALGESVSPGRLLYLAGRDRRPDIEAALRNQARPFTLVEIYAANRVPALPPAAATALRCGEIEAVLHYSVRSACAYVTLAEAETLLPQALAPIQLCLSAAIAREVAGARLVKFAASPDESHLLALLGPARRS